MNPWEKYAAQPQQPAEGPWTRYGAPDQKPAMSLGEKAEDIARSGVTGIIKGGAALAGLPGDIAELGARGIDRATRFIGGLVGAEIPERKDREPTYGSKAVLSAIEPYTEKGKFHTPQTTAGEYAQTIGEFAPGMLGGAGGLATRALAQVAAPAIVSETAGQMTKGSSSEPYARVAGALAGGFAPSAIGRVATPLPINAERAAAVNTLRNEGVTDLTAGQVTGRRPLQYLEAERGRGANLMESQGEQFTQAALRRTGENATRATPEVIDQAFTRVGQQFDDLAARNTITVDQQFGNELGQAVQDYMLTVAPPNRAPAIGNFVQELVNAHQTYGGVLPGRVYQSLRSRMEATARQMGNNPEARNALRGMREALDDAMERSIANPADAAAWREARNQYRNLLTVERALTTGGEAAAEGLITPAKLRQATVTTQGRRNYARGQGEFVELARAGQQVMSPLPNSGTAGRISAQNIGAGALSLLGGTGGAAYSGGDPAMTGLGFIAGMLAPRAVGRAATSRIGRAYLGNQAATPLLNATTPSRSAIVNALMAAQQQRLEAPR